MPQIPSNLLSENQGVLSKQPVVGYVPTAEEKKTIQLVEQLFSDAKRHRTLYDEKWLSNYKFFRGKQWENKRPAYRHSEVLNYIASEVYTVMVLMTDNRPQIETIPEDPTDFEFSEILSEILSSKWDFYNWSMTVAEAIVDASIYGTAIGEVPWKEELEDGLGDFEFETCDPFYFFPDPNAKSKVNDEYCDYVVKAYPVDLGKLRRQYPKMKDFIKADVSDLSTMEIDRESLNDIRYRSPSDNRLKIDGERGADSRKTHQALLIEAYLRSEETEEVELEGEVDAETGIAQKLYQTKKKYPYGRKICITNGVLLSDETLEEYGGKKFPFARLVDYIIPREFWGVGEVDRLKSPQQIINSLVSYILDYMKLMGNPIWVVDANSGIETDNLTNQPGLVIEKNPGTEARRESGVPLPGYVMELFQFMTERIIGKLGSTTDVSKGVSPSANASGYAIQQLTEASQTQIRGKARNLEIFLKDVGDLMVDRILEKYTLPRIIRLTSNENAARYFEFSINKEADETGEVRKFANVQEMTVDPVTKQTIPGPQKTIELKSRLDVRMSVGSTLPFSKQIKAQQARELFKDGILTPEDYLDSIEWPGREKIIQKLKERQGMEAAQGAQNGNATTTAPGGGPPSGPVSAPTA